MRLRSQWFRNAQPRTPEDRGRAMAVIAWKIAQNAIKSTRQANFQVDAGAPYMAFLQEFLIFLIQVTDRLIAQRAPWNVRVTFINTLAQRLADLMADNQSTLLGGDPALIRSEFIRLLNDRAEHYAEFEFDPQNSHFGFVRYLGSALQPVMNGPDQTWILDYIMLSAAPEAIDHLQKALTNLFDETPRQRRVRGSVIGPE